MTQRKVNIADYEKELEQKGGFILVFERSIDAGKVIELCYTRQEIEQVFDLGKNYADMLPLGISQTLSTVWTGTGTADSQRLGH